jgi:hypothetical protein
VSLGGEYDKKYLPRLHVWALNFTQSDLAKCITEKFNHQPFTQVFQTQFPFKQWENMYLNNRQMGDENRYIFERKLQEARAGLILEKPCLLLKRNFIKDTNFIEEKLNEGTNYAKIEEKP